MHYFIIPSVGTNSLAKAVLCYKKLETGNWTYKQSAVGLAQNVLVPDKAQIFEIPDPLDQLIFLAESTEMGLLGTVIRLLDNRVFEVIKTVPIER